MRTRIAIDEWKKSRISLPHRKIGVQTKALLAALIPFYTRWLLAITHALDDKYGTSLLGVIAPSEFI